VLQAADVGRQLEVAADEEILLGSAGAAVEHGGQLVQPLLGEVAQLPAHDVIGVAVGDGVYRVAGGEVAEQEDAARYRGGDDDGEKRQVGCEKAVAH